MEPVETRTRSSGGRYFIDLYLERYVPSHFELKLVPTYRCNLDCSYCYARPFRRRHPEEMSWGTFRGLVERFVAEQGRSVRFLGGEPTLWAEIDRALVHLRELDLRTFVLTNGTVALGELPDEIHLNIEHYGEGALKNRVLSVLESYRSRGALVRFRYNIQPSDPEGKLDGILGLARRYSVPSVHLGTAWPHEKTRAFGRQVLESVRKILGSGLACTLGDPMPFCIFTDGEREELRETANFSGRCMCGHIPLVNPDGRSVFPCQAVGVLRPASELTALRNVRRAFRHDVGLLVRSVEDRCLSCRHFLVGECQDGCLGNRVGRHARTDVPTQAAGLQVRAEVPTQAAGLLGEAAGAGRFAEVAPGDVFRAATPAELPSTVDRSGGLASGIEGAAGVSCHFERGTQEFARGDRVAILASGDAAHEDATREEASREEASRGAAARLAVILGLPGETVALTPGGDLFVQNLSAPGGARLMPAWDDDWPLAGLVEDAALFDIGEFEVLVARAVARDGRVPGPAGPVRKEPIRSLAGRLTAVADESGTRAIGVTSWETRALAGPLEVTDLALVAGGGAPEAGGAARSGRQNGPDGAARPGRQNGPDASAQLPELCARFDLVAPRGSTVEIELLDAKSHLTIARGFAFQSRDGRLGHEVCLERTGPRRRAKSCLLAAHVAGTCLASVRADVRRKTQGDDAASPVAEGGRQGRTDGRESG